MKRLPLWLLSAFFIGAGVAHFLYPEAYLKIVPTFLPKPLLLVQLSGFFEIGLGALILIPRYRKLGGLGLIILLVAVLPANIQMAFHANLFPEFNAILLWLRIPLQFVIMTIVYQITNRI